MKTDEVKGKKRKNMTGLIIALCLLALLCAYLSVQAIQCSRATKEAEAALTAYAASEYEASFGRITYLDKGSGEPILVFHGIFGGYDQGYETLQAYAEAYRLICPSRFGYLGSDMPENATVSMQTQAFAELLDSLGLEKVFLLGTSAGATAAIKFALDFPERTKGLILISPAAPLVEKPTETAKYAGPPKAFLSSFAMWLIKPMFPAMMGLDSSSINALLPVEARREGIIFDSAVSNTDMANNYDEYAVEQMLTPTIIFQAKDDKMADYNKTEASVSRFPDCEFVAFESGGHMLEGQNIAPDIDEFIDTNR